MTGSPPPRPSTARTSAPPVTAMRSLPRPWPVTTAFWLWYLAAGCAAAAAVLAVARLDDLHTEFEREARASDPSASADTVERAADLSVLVVVGGGVLLALMGVLFAAAMRAGKNWGRGALVLTALPAVAYGVLVVSPLGVATACVAVVASVCMYLPGSRSWFV